MMNPRPSADLGAKRSNGISDGVSNTDPLVIDMYFVNIVPFSPSLSENSVGASDSDQEKLASYRLAQIYLTLKVPSNCR